MTSISVLASALRELRQAVVLTHVSPDADALGSSAGLIWVLSRLGVTASLYLSEDAPERLQPFLSTTPIISKPSTLEMDALIVVDTASAKRASGDLEELSRNAKQVINIDHHVSNSLFGDLNYVDASAPASAVIIAELAAWLEVTLEPEAANMLLAGLMDDTGAWRFANADERSFLAAAKLVKSGADAEFVAGQLFFTLPERVLKLRAASALEMERVCGGRVAFSCVTLEMLNRFEARAEDTEGIVDLVRSVENTICAVFIREMSDGWKASLRSKVAWLDVNAVCSSFGGGGHKAAAGCKLQGDFESVKASLLSRLEEELEQVDASVADTTAC